MISWLRAAIMLLSMGASSLLLRTDKENEIKVHIVTAITLYKERRMPEGQSRCQGPLNFLDNDIAFEGKSPGKKVPSLLISLLMGKGQRKNEKALG